MNLQQFLAILLAIAILAILIRLCHEGASYLP